MKKDGCPHCGGEVHVPHPARFSIDDRYARYRRTLRRRLYESGADHPSRAQEV